jgi:hypothetical protein
MSDRLAKATEAQRLREEGLLLREIAERMGAKRTTVSAWLCDPDGSKLRARKDSYRGECIDCGARTDGSNGRANAPRRCDECSRRFRHERRIWTPDTIVEAIRAFHDQYGFVPCATDWSPALAYAHTLSDAEVRARRYETGAWPPTATVLKECGSWNAAIRAAGFEPNREFNRPFAADPTVPRRAAAMYQTGHTLDEVGEAFGVSGKCVGMWLDRIGAQRRTPRESRTLREAREQVAA